MISTHIPPVAHFPRTLIVLALVLLAGLPNVQAGELKLANLFTSHMVLQTGMAVPVWGWADTGETVRVQFAGQTQTATADANGKWLVKLAPLPVSSEPRELLATAGQDSLKLSDVLVGEVWLASGQSNMSLTVHECFNAEQEIAAADHPQLRLFSVGGNPSLKRLDTLTGQWASASPKTVGSFSAAGYYFGRELQQTLNVPVGVINSSWGGTPAEGWTRLEALKTIPRYVPRAESEIGQMLSKANDEKQFPIKLAQWQTQYGVLPPATTDNAKDWAGPVLDAADWKPISLPGSWAHAGFKTGGVFWVRKEINVPAAMANKPLPLSLANMDEDENIAFWNGVEVGKEASHYDLPARLVTAGRNVLALRIVSATETVWGKKIDLPIPNQPAPDDKWLVKQERAFPALSAEAVAARPQPNKMEIRWVSAADYNGMIHPLIPFAIKGVIWYQGEGNSGRSAEYQELITLLITDWRKQWGEGDFAFIIQQLVNIGEPAKDPNQVGTWPVFRDVQWQLANTVPNCGIAVGIDIGEVGTVHARNKQDVGKRLAMVALEKTYGKKLESSGPCYDSMKIEGAAIRVKFTHADGLQSKGGELQRFAIAGVDKKFVWANATIAGDTVVVACPQVAQPVAVRYAWTTNPDGCNLTNAAMLPAVPFRTDAW